MLVYLGTASLAFFAVIGALYFRSVFQNADGLRLIPSRGTRYARAKRSLRKRDRERVNLETIDASSIEESAKALNKPLGAALKRAFDIAFSLTLLVFLAPLLAMTAIAIRLDSPGPVIYRQKRVGRNGATFYVLKFRSMVTDAERGGPQYASVGDTRITNIGHFIRRMRIDEIPQTINVLRGEMSFVGPRPERPEFVETLESEIPHYSNRHLVKPGITGWAQVKYEYAASVAGAKEKLRYDLFYITRYSPLMDIAIVLLTIRVALFGIGSR